MSRSIRRLFARHRDEGIALPMVLIVFVVSVALVLAFLVSIVGSSTVTATNKAMVQAQAAAQAGIASAQVAWADDPCGSTPLEVSDPTATVTRSCDAIDGTVTFESTATIEGTRAIVEAVFGLESGESPADPGVDSIVFAGSEGFATYPGLELSTIDGSLTRVTIRETTFTCNGITVPGDIIAGGDVSLSACKVLAGVHIGGTLGPASNTANDVTGDLLAAGAGEHILSGTMRGDVHVNGRAALQYNSTILGDLIVAGPGTTRISGTVAGDVIVAGDVLLEWGAHVGGSIIASGTGNVTIRMGSTPVEGDVIANGAVEVSQWGATLPGSIMAGGTVRLAGGNNVGAGVSGCAVGSVSGDIDWRQPPSGVSAVAKSCQITASTLQTRLGTAPARVDAPEIPDWRPYAFVPAGWSGFDVVKVDGAACARWKSPVQENGQWVSDWNLLQSATTKTVFDLTSCGTVSTSDGNIRKLQTIGHDIALIITQANLYGLQIAAAPGTTPRIWFVTPGQAENGRPVCTTASPSVLFESTKIVDPVQAMVYTPCEVRLSNTDFTGNLYAGSVDVGGTPKVRFAALGLPGWGTPGGSSGTQPGGDSGTPPGGPIDTGAVTLGVLQHQRNVGPE